MEQEKIIKLIASSFSDKTFVAKLLHDSIPEYKDYDLDYIIEHCVLEKAADIECVGDANCKLTKVVVNFEAADPSGQGLIGFTVNFVI